MVRFSSNQKRNTKELIFDIALEQISKYGYDLSDMRTIAKLSHIKVSSIYNHYKSKKQILNEFYLYYIEHFYDNKLDDSIVLDYLSKGTLSEFAKALIFTFESADKVKYQRMILITKVIYTRMYKDQKAQEIFMKLMNEENEVRISNFLQQGINIGRFSHFDTKTYALLFVNTRHVMAIRAFLDPNYQVKQLEEEEKLDELFLSLLEKFEIITK